MQRKRMCTAVAEGFMWSVFGGRIPPLKPPLKHVYDAAKHAPISHFRHPVGARKIGFQAFDLHLHEPITIRHGLILLPPVNQKLAYLEILNIVRS